VLDALEYAGCIQRKKISIAGARPCTVIRASDSLIQLLGAAPTTMLSTIDCNPKTSPPVVIKDPSDKFLKHCDSRLPTPETKLIQDIRDQTLAINAHINSFHLDSPQAIPILTPTAVFGHYPGTLYRVFNNGGLEHGGRYYGGFWQDLSAIERQSLRIKGEALTCLDYEAMGLRLALAHVGSVVSPHTDPYQRLLDQCPALRRKAAKLAINACLSSYAPLRVAPKRLRELLPKGVSWSAIQALIARAYPELHGLWFRGFGLKLQRKDSDIMTDILLNSITTDLALLPIHDGLLCPRSQAKDAKELMVSCYRNHVHGQSPKINTEW
jgi:hypothetical protein